MKDEIKEFCEKNGYEIQQVTKIVASQFGMIHKLMLCEKLSVPAYDSYSRTTDNRLYPPGFVLERLGKYVFAQSKKFILYNNSTKEEYVKHVNTKRQEIGLKPYAENSKKDETNSGEPPINN
jgi:Ni,Fe-hydrogenase I large subunit